jgi:hypothetical protein
MTRLWALAVFTVVLVVACDKVPLTSPTGSTISVSIDREVLPLGGTATVTAVVTEVSGTAVHNGTMVTFQPSIGRTDPVDAPTVNGIATVTFLAGSSSGAGVIHAFSGGARTGAGNSSPNGAVVRIGTAGVERVSVRSEPLNVPITGGTVVVVAGIFDGSGNPITNTPIAFSSDFGALSANSATTDGNGEARVNLTTNRTTRITVTAGSKTGDFTLTALSPPTVVLNCGTTRTATVGVPITCTVTATVGGGNASSSAPIQNVTINWGDGTGEQALGAATGETAVAHTYSSSGTFQVQAAATDANSQRGTHLITLTVTRAIPTITITGPATGTVGVSVIFTVIPPSNPSVPTSSVVVDFGDGTTRNLGAITAQQSVTKVYTSPGVFTVSATITDNVGTRNTSTTSIVISGSSGPTVVLTQSGTLSGGCGSFTVTLTPSSGTTIQSGSVRLDRTGADLYTGTTTGTFAACSLVVNDILTARYTDSNGITGTTQLLVR